MFILAMLKVSKYLTATLPALEQLFYINRCLLFLALNNHQLKKVLIGPFLQYIVCACILSSVLLIIYKVCIVNSLPATKRSNVVPIIMSTFVTLVR